jgi:peptidoglycan hydrolase-like protein with peptidoglycan-binding domain
MVVRIKPRNDRVLVNEPAGETRHNVGWTEQRRLKGKIGSLRATAVALDALSARERWRNKRGLFGMLLRLGFALSTVAIVGSLVTGRFSPLWHTGGSETATIGIELQLANETVADRRSIPPEWPPAAESTRIDDRGPAGSNDSQTSKTSPDKSQTQLAALLDLLRSEDATNVQRRLIELRLLSGPADGVWGSRSRSALRSFRIANNLGSDDKWDGHTQQELFKTSVAPGSSANRLGTKVGMTETLPGAARNPLNHSDALWIQKRLHDMGYYFGNVDGVWRASSRNALRDFKAINGLQENDTWDKETEERLSSGQDIHPSSIFLGRWAVDFGQCRQLQDSSALITINSRRAETVGGACNFRSIKRAGMNKWRIHALCSADGNSWNANIVLKLIGSELRWSSERGSETYVRCPKHMDAAMTEARDGYSSR